MTMGFKVRNTAGEIAIDDVFLNYSLIQEGTYTAAVFTGGSVWPTSVLTFSRVITSVEPPIVAITWPLTDVIVRGITYIGTSGNWTGFQLRFNYTVSGQARNSVQVTYKVFATGMKSTAGWGLRVRTADGRISFDSGAPILKIAAIHSPSTWSLSSTSLPYTGFRASWYTSANPAPGGYLVVDTLRFADLAYPNGNEGQAPVAYCAYGYGPPTGGSLSLRLTMDTYSNSVNPSALSTPAAYAGVLIY